MNPLTPVIAVALLVATVKTVTDFPAYVAARQWSPVWKQLVAWAAGIGGAFALAASDLGTSIQATDTLTLATANHWTVALFGFAAASGASFTHQYLQARDNTQSAYVPPLTSKQPATMGTAVHDFAPTAPVEPPVPAAPASSVVPAAGVAGVSIPVPKG